MHIHILGICGTFMGGLALMARQLGHRVTGCDANVYPPMSTQLAEQGIELIEGFEASQTALAPDMYVIGNVVTRGNPLMEAILNAGHAYTSGPQWLSEHVLRDKWTLAVAGTHGKTTTSSMLAWILEANGLAPGFLIGGVPQNFGLSARISESAFFVIEADEYDTAFFDKRSKFVHYRPRTAVLNNLEFDHADIFPDLGAIETQFHHLVRTVPSIGRIVVNAGDEALRRVLARGCWSEVESFGPQATWTARGEDDDFEVRLRDQTVGRVEWKLLGTHNRMNALSAIAAAHHAGVRPADACEALSSFENVKRRMELKASIGDIHVYDDFAHHPTAIATTVEGLRRKVGQSGRILAVLEPRSNTMKLGTMKSQLPGALTAADRVFGYGAAEGKQALGWDLQAALMPLGSKAQTFDTIDALLHSLVEIVQPHDHVLIMSNGSFGGLPDKLVLALRQAKPSTL